MITLIVWILLLAQVWAATLVGYLLLLTLAAFRARPLAKLRAGEPRQRFAVLIPAHNEELLLPGLLSSLAAQQYPPHLWHVHVVADNCTDRTALVAQAGGAEAHIRIDAANPGKGPALQWLFERVCRPEAALDAVVILDADSVVSPNFLQVMSEHLEHGENVIQAYYAVRDPALSWNSGLRQAALSVLHFLRPQGRMTLGASVGLKGNGMVFTIDTLRNYNWSTSVTEDIELHMRLILNGERVTFAPDAQVLGEMPNTLENSSSQHLRWESGKMEMARRYVPHLLRQSLRAASRGQFRKAILLLDAVFEYWIPPFSILFGISCLLALGNLALVVFQFSVGQISTQPVITRLIQVNLILCLFILIGQVVYLVSGLVSIHAPKAIYRSLLYSPIYILWKNLQLLKTIFGRGPQEWVRTKRNEG